MSQGAGKVESLRRRGKISGLFLRRISVPLLTAQALLAFVSSSFANDFSPKTPESPRQTYIYFSKPSLDSVFEMDRKRKADFRLLSRQTCESSKSSAFCRKHQKYISSLLTRFPTLTLTEHPLGKGMKLFSETDDDCSIPKTIASNIDHLRRRADFSPVCRDHDYCYRNLKPGAEFNPESQFQKCNDIFLTELEQVCQNRSRPESFTYTGCEVCQLKDQIDRLVEISTGIGCRVLTDVFHTGVSVTTASRKAFIQAKEKQAELTSELIEHASSDSSFFEDAVREISLCDLIRGYQAFCGWVQSSAAMKRKEGASALKTAVGWGTFEWADQLTAHSAACLNSSTAERAVRLLQRCGGR